MNKKTMRLLTDGLIAIVLCCILRWSGLENASISMGLTINLSILPFVWLGLRYGVAAPIVFAAIAGLINSFIPSGEYDMSGRLLMEITPLIFGGLAGLFARYTQKTLNNRRLSSTRLNIVTATILSTLSFYLMRFIIIPTLINVANTNGASIINLWGGWLLSAILGSIILILSAQLKPELIIPKRSKYLTRKETSRLLND